MKHLYDVTIKLAVIYKHTDKHIKDENGNVRTSDENQLKRWREHFKELLNRPPPQNPSDIAPSEDVLHINCERPSKAEIEKTIHNVKIGKDMGAIRNTNLMERKVPREAPKERRYARMSESQRDSAPNSTQKDPQQSHIGQTEDRGRCQAQIPPS